MSRKNAAAQIIVLTTCGLASAVWASADNDTLRWSGAANVTSANHPGNWDRGFRPEAHHQLAFRGGGEDGQQWTQWDCSFDVPISAGHIPFVQSLSFTGPSGTNILGDPQIRWIGDGPNLSTGMVSAGFGGEVSFRDSMYLRADHLQVLWGGEVRVFNARVDTGTLAISNVLDVWDGGDVRVGGGNLALGEGRLNIAGGRVELNGDVALWSAPNNHHTPLTIRNGYTFDQVLGELRIHGELVVEAPDEDVLERMLSLERGILHVNALDLRAVDLSPEEGGSAVNFRSGRLIVDGGRMRLRADRPFVLSPNYISEDGSRLTLQLANGAVLDHGNDVIVSNGFPRDDCLGQLTISSAGPQRSGLACHELRASVGTGDVTQFFMSGGADLFVLEDALFGSGTFARSSMIMHAFPGVAHEPMAIFRRDLRIGNTSAQGVFEVKAGTLQVHGDLHLGRHKGEGSLLVSGDDGRRPTSVIVGGTLYGAGPIDQFPEQGQLHVFDGAKMKVHGPAHLGYGLDLMVGSGGELTFNGDTAIYNPQQVHLRGGSLTIGGAITSEEGAIEVPEFGFNGGQETVLRLADGIVKGDILIGQGHFDSPGIVHVEANDMLTLEATTIIGGKGGGLLSLSPSASVLCRRSIGLDHNARVRVAGRLHGVWLNSMGRGVETVDVIGGQVELSQSMLLNSWDPKMPSTLTVTSKSEVRVARQLRADEARVESNSIVEADFIVVDQLLQFVLKNQPETNAPIVTARNMQISGRIEILGNKYIGGMHLGQRWPLLQTASGIFWTYDEDIQIIDDDPFDGISYRLVPAGKRHLLAVDIVATQKGDTDGDGDVDWDDFFAIIDAQNQQCGHWNAVQKFCPTDIDHDGVTGLGDLWLCIDNLGR